MRRWTPLIFLFTVGLLGADCDENLSSSESLVDRSDVAPLDGGSVWLSDPWQIEDEEFRGLIEIEPTSRIRLCHGLGRNPIEVHAYVGFDSNTSRVMPVSGNAAEIHQIDDDSDPDFAGENLCNGPFITIRNGSGGSFYYRFLLR